MPVYLELPRDMVTARCDAGDRAAAAPGGPGGAGRMRRRDPRAPRQAKRAGADGRCRGAPLPGGGARSPTSPAGCRLPAVTSFMGRGLLATARRAAARHLSRCRRRSASYHPAGRGLGRAAAAGRHVSDTNFGVSAQHIDLRKAIHAWIAGRGRPPRLPRHPAGELVGALLERLPRRRPRSAPRGLARGDPRLRQGRCADRADRHRRAPSTT